MSCPASPSVFTIFTGNAKTMYLKAAQAECGIVGDPLSLDAVEEIDIALPNADGTFAHLLLTEGDIIVTDPAILGKFSAAIASDVSALLQPGELQSFDVTFTFAGKPFTVRYFNCLSVFEND